MIGRTVAHYKILDEISEGGMGGVYRTQDITLGRDVALKFLHEKVAVGTDHLKRFQHEAKALVSLKCYRERPWRRTSNAEHWTRPRPSPS